MRGIRIDFNTMTEDGMVLCNIFQSERGLNGKRYPEEGEIVELYDDEFAMMAEVLWASGTDIEVQVIHDYGV